MRHIDYSDQLLGFVDPVADPQEPAPGRPGAQQRFEQRRAHPAGSFPERAVDELPCGERRSGWEGLGECPLGGPLDHQTEMLNVLRKLVLRGEIDEELAETSRLAIRELRLTRHPLTDQMSDRVWQLRRNVSAYDASYLALAEQLRVPLVTADQRLAEAGRRLATVVIECYIVDGAS